MELKFKRVFDYIDNKMDNQKKETTNIVASSMHNILGDLNKLNREFRVTSNHLVGIGVS